jgi:hypothetical protein
MARMAVRAPSRSRAARARLASVASGTSGWPKATRAWPAWGMTRPLGRMRLVPRMATGRTGTPVRTANANGPLRKGSIRPPPGPRLPSGKITRTRPSSSTRSTAPTVPSPGLARSTGMPPSAS